VTVALQEALSKTLRGAYHYQRNAALRGPRNALEVDAARMFSQQSWDVLHALYSVDLSEAAGHMDAKTAAIIAAIAAALSARLSSDVALLTPGIEQSLAAGIARSAVMRVGLGTSVGSDAAQAWLAAHGAELVTGIDQWTKQQLQTIVSSGIAAGDSVTEIAQAIVARFNGFTAQRALTIAMTESSTAWSWATMEFGRQLAASGANVSKIWILSLDHDVVDECDDNAAVGAIPLQDFFPTGHLSPPEHPNCKCGFEVFETGTSATSAINAA